MRTPPTDIFEHPSPAPAVSRWRRPWLLGLIAIALVLSSLAAVAKPTLPVTSQVAGVSAQIQTPFLVEVSDGFENRTLPWNAGPIRKNDGTPAVGLTLVNTVIRPNGTTAVFEQKTDSGGLIRGQLYASILNQTGTYTLKVHVAGGGPFVTDTFTLTPPIDLSGDNTFEGNVTINGTLTGTSAAFGSVVSAAGFDVGGTPGTTAACGSGEVYDAQEVAGGIVTGGTCTSSSGLVSLQDAYDNGEDISLTSGAVDITSAISGSSAFNLRTTAPGGNTPSLNFNNGTNAFGIYSQDVLKIGPYLAPDQAAFDTTIEINANGEVRVEPVTDDDDAFGVYNDSANEKVFGVDTLNNMVGINIDTPETELQIGGPGANESEGSLSFGDYDEATFHGVVIGEEGPGDTDVLQLQGEEGIKVTTGDTSEFTIQTFNSNGEVDFYPVTDVTDAFEVNNANDDQVIFSVDTLNERIGVNDSTPETEIQVRGQGVNGSEGRLSFGDYNDADWHGVVVGEFGTGDTDQLQLQGAGGVEITTGDTGEHTIVDVDAGTGQTEIVPITDGASFIVNNAADDQTPFVVDTANSRLGVNDTTPDARLELEREDEAAEENGILLSTSNANDWKIYQPTGSSDLHFWNDDLVTDVAELTTDGQLQLEVQGSTGGLQIGGDTQVYRSAADTLRTSDTLEIPKVTSVADLTLSAEEEATDAGGGIITLNDAGGTHYPAGNAVIEGGDSSTFYGQAGAQITLEGAAPTGSNILLKLGGQPTGGTTASFDFLDKNDVLLATLTQAGTLTVNGSGTNPAAFNRNTNDGTIVSLQQAGTEEGTISVAGNTVSYNAFTGSHYARSDGDIEPGLLVSMTSDNGRLGGRDDSEIIYGVAPTAKANDPAVLGAYLSVQEPDRPQSDENPSLVTAVGNGEIWVVDSGSNLEPGDPLVSSETAGHAMKDPGTYERSHVIGKVAEVVDWDEVNETVDGKKHQKVSVLFGSYDMARADGAATVSDARSGTSELVLVALLTALGIEGLRLAVRSVRRRPVTR